MNVLKVFFMGMILLIASFEQVNASSSSKAKNTIPLITKVTKAIAKKHAFLDNKRIAQLLFAKPGATTKPGLSKNEKKLIELAQSGNNDDIETLLKADASLDINCKDNNGNTPLIIAAKSINRAVIPVLCSKGANINACNARGDTAFQAVIRDVVEAEIGSGNYISSRFGLRRAMIKRFDLLKLLVECGCDINYSDSTAPAQILLLLLENALLTDSVTHGFDYHVQQDIDKMENFFNSLEASAESIWYLWFKQQRDYHPVTRAMVVRYISGLDGWQERQRKRQELLEEAKRKDAQDKATEKADAMFEKLMREEKKNSNDR